MLNLAQVLIKQGRCEEGRTVLLEIYCWFTEGFDTTDLKDAKALLEELSGSPSASEFPRSKLASVRTRMFRGRSRP